jgi:hypothetical protein
MLQDVFRQLTDILDLSQLRVRQNLACRVAGVRCQDNTGTTSNLLGDLVWVHVISILLREWDRDCAEVTEQGQHLVVGGVIWNLTARCAVSMVSI